MKILLFISILFASTTSSKINLGYGWTINSKDKFTFTKSVIKDNYLTHLQSPTYSITVSVTPYTKTTKDHVHKIARIAGQKSVKTHSSQQMYFYYYPSGSSYVVFNDRGSRFVVSAVNEKVLIQFINDLRVTL